MATERNLVKPNGWANPSKETVDILHQKSDSVAERRMFCMPYYTWCNNVNGHTVEMTAVEERMSGCMGHYTYVVLFINGTYKAKLGVNGESSEIANYLRGGSFEGIGASLAEHEQIEKGKNTIPYLAPMPKLLQELLQ
jgi:hypothetical protein